MQGIHIDPNHTLACFETLLVCGSLAAMGVGWRARGRSTRRHAAAMLCALGLQAAFVVAFVVRYAWFGTVEPIVGAVPFRGVLTIHQSVSVIATPLVLATAATGLLGATGAHREIAKTALAAWVFVSVTGVAVYVWVYVLAGRWPWAG